MRTENRPSDLATWPLTPAASVDASQTGVRFRQNGSRELRGNKNRRIFQRVLPQVEQRNHVAADGRQDEEDSIIVE